MIPLFRQWSPVTSPHLEGAFLIRRLPPFEANLRKRLVRSPRIYWRYPGLLHALLRWRTDDDLFGQPWVGGSWEGFVSEQILSRRSRGERFEPFCFRTLVTGACPNAASGIRPPGP